MITLERSDSPLVDTLRNVRANSRPRIEAAAQGSSPRGLRRLAALDASVPQFVAALQQPANTTGTARTTPAGASSARTHGPS